MRTLLVLLLASALLLSTEIWAGPATDQLKGTLDDLIVILNDPALKVAGREEERNAALHGILKRRFDEEAIARKTLRQYWQRITPEERQEFITLFSDLLERTYFEKIDAQLEETGEFSSSDIHYLKEKPAKGNAVQVYTEISTGEGSDGIPVVFLLKQANGEWLVVDLSIEGVIITKNYRAQFSETLSRSPMGELIKKLRAKQTEK